MTILIMNKIYRNVPLQYIPLGIWFHRQRFSENISYFLEFILRISLMWQVFLYSTLNPQAHPWPDPLDYNSK